MLATAVHPELRAPWGLRRFLSRSSLVAGAWLLLAVTTSFWAIWVGMMAGLFPAESFPKLDFFTFYAASSLALDGAASSAYEAEAIARAESVLPGGGDGGFLAWLNPPAFFFAVLPLALLPVTASYVAWLALTGSFALSAVYRIAADKPLALMLALTFPASLVNLATGHNGFVMAGAFAWGMLLLRDRPVLAGAALGLLAFKPQFFPLVLVALIAAREYRAAATALACVAMLCLTSVPAFGVESWTGFLEAGERYSEYLYGGVLDVGEMHSLSAVMVLFGAPGPLARVTQAVLAVACCAFVWWLWRGGSSLEYRAAGLAVATLLATPYSYAYDLCLLGMAALWLASAFQREGWRPGDAEVLLLAWVAPLSYLLVGFSLTPLALVALVGVMARRLRDAPRPRNRGVSATVRM
jgi:hypothetical protein